MAAGGARSFPLRGHREIDMFTGIVEETGVVQEVVTSTSSIRLRLEAQLSGEGTKRGDSLAVNGCCLTVAELTPRGKRRSLEFDLLKETWQRTNLKDAKPGSLVNLERALAADGRLHGHFVTGHIDGVGKIKTLEKRGADWFLEITPPSQIMRYIVSKGAIAVDGMSLTVAEVTKKSFAIWIIPHTWQVTALKERRAGDFVNLEADMLAKYAERLLQPLDRR
jgi:riboflavin synthase